MRSLYVHGGLAKTGTTSVQRYFSQQRDSLRALGYDYPQMWINKAGSDGEYEGDADQEGTAHHNVADEILGNPRFLPKSGNNRDLLEYLKRPDRLPNVVLSTEGIASCISKTKKLDKFVQLISAAQQSNDQVRVVLMFRNFARLLESWYIQKLKTGRMDSTLDEFIDETMHWLRRLFRNIRYLQRTLGEDVFVPIDLAQPPSDSVIRLLSILNAPPPELGESPARFNERLGLKKIAILYRFQHSPDGKVMPKQTADVLRLFRVLRTLPDFQDEQYGYRLISHKAARKIQYFVRKWIPSGWSDVLSSASLSEQESYEAVNLSKVYLAKDELEFVRASLPNEMRSDGAFV